MPPHDNGFPRNTIPKSWYINSYNWPSNSVQNSNSRFVCLRLPAAGGVMLSGCPSVCLSVGPDYIFFEWESKARVIKAN